MIVLSAPDASASTRPATHLTSIKTAAAAVPTPPANGRDTQERSPIRHLLFGSIHSVRTTIQRLHQLGYAEPNDWSQPIPTAKPGEVMAVLTKRANTL